MLRGNDDFLKRVIADPAGDIAQIGEDNSLVGANQLEIVIIHHADLIDRLPLPVDDKRALGAGNPVKHVLQWDFEGHNFRRPPASARKPAWKRRDLPW